MREVNCGIAQIGPDSFWWWCKESWTKDEYRWTRSNEGVESTKGEAEDCAQASKWFMTEYPACEE